MAEKKEILEKIITGVLLLLTLLYGGWIYHVSGCRIWILIQSDRMGEAGDFIAGFTTPVVFLWLIYGYFLQRRELGLQRKELYEMQTALKEQVEAMDRQTGVMQTQASDERLERFMGR